MVGITDRPAVCDSMMCLCSDSVDRAVRERNAYLREREMCVPVSVVNVPVSYQSDSLSCNELCACDQAFKSPQRHQKLSSMISPAERFNERERATNAPGIGIAYVLCMMVLMVSLPP